MIGELLLLLREVVRALATARGSLEMCDDKGCECAYCLCMIAEAKVNLVILAEPRIIGLVALVRSILAYVALSQGTLYNPRLSEMLRELVKEVELKS